MTAGNLGRDVTYGWRRLRATPVFTIFAVLTLAVGIGVTSGIYSVVRAALAPPSGIHDAKTVMYLFHAPCCSVPIHSLSWPDFVDFRARQTVFDAVAAYGAMRQMVAAPAGAETVWGEIVTGNFFSVLGVNAALGRTLQPQDDEPAAPLVVVLSHGLWQRLFNESPDAVGQTLRMRGRPFQVVGIAPAEFRGLSNNGLIPSAMWIPLESAALFPELGMAERDDRDARRYRVVGRLKSNRRIEEAASEASVIARQLDAEFPIGRDLDRRLRAPYNTSRPWAVRSAADLKINIAADQSVSWLTTVVMGAAGLVLMVVCTNLANLLIARGSLKRKELTVRLALGASRWRLAREALVESGVLAIAGGLVGLGLARLLVVWLGTEASIAPGNSLVLEPRIDGMVLLASFAATLTALLVAGLSPALQAARTDLRTALSFESGLLERPRWRGRQLLIAGQVAVSVVLLAVASLFLAQLVQESRFDTGIDLDRIVVAEVDFSQQGIDDTRTRQIVADVLGQLMHRSDVATAAVSSGLPIGITTPGGILRGAGQRPAFVEFVSATPGIFDTLGVSIVRGRSLAPVDLAGSEPVMIVNETTARQLFGTIEVVGRRLEVQRRRWVGEPEPAPQTRTIIGVASDSDARMPGRRDSGVIYLPFEQQFESRLVFSARVTEGDPATLVGVVRSAIRAAGPAVGITRIGSGQAVLSPPNLFAQMSAGLTAVLGGFALIVALAGLYGVLSHIVARRTREIGLRISLGASRAQMLYMVIRQGLAPVIGGVVIGDALGSLVRMGLRPQFARLIPAVDLWVLVGVPVLLLGVGLLACLIPARRAASVDPNVALRAM